MTPRLSVVVPAYNREHTLPATLASVAGCGVPTQLIVVDDGSRDATAAVAAGFPGATVVRQANAGPAAARNAGLAVAGGEFVAFLDSDDHWHPDVLPVLLPLLDAHPDLDAVLCETLVGSPDDGYRPISETTGRGRFGDLLTDPVGPDLYRLDPDRLLEKMLDRNQVFLGSLVVRRAVCPQFDPALFGGEDYGFALRLVAERRLGFFVRPLAVYEKHPGGLSADPDRMAREFAKAVAGFVAHTRRLAPARRAQARAKLRRLRWEYAYRAFDRGDYLEARRRAAVGLRDGRSARLFALAAACTLPAGLVRRLRALKQRVAP